MYANLPETHDWVNKNDDRKTAKVPEKLIPNPIRISEKQSDVF